MTKSRLLLVDDDPDLGLVVRVLTRRDGYDLTHHLDAESAWAGLDAARPDLILLDVNLPGTSGLDFLRRLRASPHARQAVALFVQPALTQDIVAGWAAGADYLVSKDLVTRPDAWKKRLDEILAHLHGRAFGTSLSLENVNLSEARGESPQILPRFPPLDGLTPELLQTMKIRAAAVGPSSQEGSQTFLLRLIDQVGCLFGGAAVEKILEHFHAEKAPTESPRP